MFTDDKGVKILTYNKDVLESSKILKSCMSKFFLSKVIFL